MNVVELKDILSGLPDEMEIFMSSDAEGNDLHSVDTVLREKTYDGDTVAVVWPMHDNQELF